MSAALVLSVVVKGGHRKAPPGGGGGGGGEGGTLLHFNLTAKLQAVYQNFFFLPVVGISLIARARHTFSTALAFGI